jgi:pre-mRNA-splicing helicase BRR2
VPGDYDLKIYVMCDSYVGCDQEYEFSMTVLPSDDIEEMEE